jgi:hypothetical protein
MVSFIKGKDLKYVVNVIHERLNSLNKFESMTILFLLVKILDQLA